MRSVQTLNYQIKSNRKQSCLIALLEQILREYKIVYCSTWHCYGKELTTNFGPITVHRVIAQPMKYTVMLRLDTTIKTKHDTSEICSQLALPLTLESRSCVFLLQYLLFFTPLALDLHCTVSEIEPLAPRVYDTASYFMSHHEILMQK